jgi:hypothetical protein
MSSRRRRRGSVSNPESRPRPNFFLVGAPKCATTSLFAALAQHPDVFVPKVKELYYFDEDHERLRLRRFTLEEYLAFYAGAGGAKRLGDGSTSYLHSQVAAERIHEFEPEARIIAMVRNPVDIVHALHAMIVRRGTESILDFERALAAEPERKAGGRLPRSRGLMPFYLHYREVATLTPQLERYLSTFGPEAVKIIVFDDWVRDSAPIYRETLGFLGVDEDFSADLRPVNPSRRVRSERLYRFVNEPPPRLQRVVASTLPRNLRARIGYFLQDANTYVSPRPPMRPELRRQLLEEFAPEVERLGALLGRDLSPWTRDERLPATATAPARV